MWYRLSKPSYYPTLRAERVWAITRSTCSGKLGPATPFKGLGAPGY